MEDYVSEISNKLIFDIDGKIVELLIGNGGMESIVELGLMKGDV